ncbi:dipeptidase [Mucilaginibacter glaciei]|uniref:Membrane dipeptidase n=1 Tax=Mucilaginibacter glaciei TaxID=2772109 RepID=A0A926NPH5_9SPHI|nr:membrane dipeptidase [Mucilaginibacter glaciei]MBD1392287.1 membrane dipeptidase [Mucilaginibacter glaciei]
MFIVDAHLDLSMNALEWNRDLQLPVADINRQEHGLTDKPDRAKAVVSLPELRKGNIGLVVATQIGRYVAPGNNLPGWHSPQQAWAQTQGQLAWYKAMEDAGQMIQITNLQALEAHLTLWANNIDKAEKPVGYILSLEGADSIVDVSYLQIAYDNGLRALGPAHYGPGRYANGTDATGKMGVAGLALLKEMERLNIILDVTHLCDDAFWQALDNFNGAIWASHNNCRALVNHNRQYSDEMIKALVDRGAVIGAALDAWMMVPNWVRGQSTPRQMNCNLEVMIDHIDHICQIAGDALHVGMGTDLDGAFGREQCPYDLETIADLQNVPQLLKKRGYTGTDVENMMHGNWLRFLRNTWK